jgi:hypothetical protein
LVLTRTTPRHQIPEDSILNFYCRENIKSYAVVFYRVATRHIQLNNGLSATFPRQQMDTTVEMLLQEALFPVRREVHLRCEPRGLRVFQPEDGSCMFLHTESSYARDSIRHSHRRERIKSCSIFVVYAAKCRTMCELQ